MERKKKVKDKVKRNVDNKLDQKIEKKGSLSKHIVLSLAVTIVAVFIIMIFIINIVTGSQIRTAVDRELYGTVDMNRKSIEELADRMASVANPVLDILADMYANEGKSDSSEVYESAVTGDLISYDKAKAEEFILDNLRSAVKNDRDIIGCGVYFEENAFSDNIYEYNPYISESDVTDGTVGRLPMEIYKTDLSYQVASNTGRVAFSDVFPSNMDDFNIVSAKFPVVYNGEFKGTVGIDVKETIFDFGNLKNDFYKSGYYDVLNENEIILYATDNKNIGMRLEELVEPKAYSDLKELMAKGENFAYNLKTDRGNVRAYYEPVKMGDATWWVQTAIAHNEYSKTSRGLSVILVVLGVLTTFVLIGNAIRLINKSLKPLEEIGEKANVIEQGNIDIELNYNGNDEIGRLAASINGMIRRFKNITVNIEYKLQEIAKGNLCVDNNETDLYVGSFNNILIVFNDIFETLNDTMSKIRLSSEHVTKGADQVSGGAQNLSQGSMEQAAAVQQISSNIQLIGEQFKETTKMSEDAKETTDNAVIDVDISNEKMAQMTEAMKEINKKSSEIANIIKAIDDIAFQTNILALNAAVEAARAGEAGQGFAVVADEVRNLAQKSAAEASSTTALIQDSLDAVNRGTSIVTETTESLIAVGDKVKEVNNIIDKIAIATKEQSVGVAEVVSGVEQIASVVQNNSATAEESAAASEELSAQATQMNTMVEKFKTR